jgi:Kef-type K+ transport system membrane component KefB
LSPLGIVHGAVALGAVFGLALLGRWLARSARQPVVIGEIALGLAAGPVVVAVGGRHVLDVLLPAEVLAGLRLVGHAGIVLFLVGVAHHLRWSRARTGIGGIASTVAGGLLVPLAAGVGLAAWVLGGGDPALRGDAPAAAVSLLLAVSLAVTALPVLARILTDSGMADTRAGRLSMTAAMVIDVVTWIIVALALGIASGGSGKLPVLLLVTASGIGAVVLMRWAPVRGAVEALRLRFPRLAVVVFAAGALAVSSLVQRLGLTEFFGAMLFGFALPAEGSRPVVATLTRVGRLLTPVFFLVTGITVFVGVLGAIPWAAIVVATLLGVLGKLGGGFLGARLGGESVRDSLRVGILLNTRGLTELVVLQAGFSAGLLTSSMYLALVVMAVFTTCLTGPACALIDRHARRRGGMKAERSVSGGEEPWEAPTVRAERSLNPRGGAEWS